MGGCPLAQQLAGASRDAQWVAVTMQELSQAKAAALGERSQAEEELIKAKSQVRMEEVSSQPYHWRGGTHCLQCPPGREGRGWA